MTPFLYFAVLISLLLGRRIYCGPVHASSDSCFSTISYKIPSSVPLHLSLSLYSSKRICIFVLLVKSNKKAYEYLKHTILFPHSVSIPKYSTIEYKCKCNFDYVQNFPFLFQFKRLSLHNRNAKTHTHKQRKYGWNARAHLIYFKIQIQKKKTTK